MKKESEIGRKIRATVEALAESSGVVNVRVAEGGEIPRGTVVFNVTGGHTSALETQIAEHLGDTCVRAVLRHDTTRETVVLGDPPEPDYVQVETNLACSCELVVAAASLLRRAAALGGDSFHDFVMDNLGFLPQVRDWDRARAAAGPGPL